ncbi:MAG: hypothetical protein KDK07_06995 [Bauldia sp.]|nr:hypothetical protein [Bauldia sp.]
MDDGRPVYEYNFFGLERYRVAGAERLAEGPHTIVLDYQQQPLDHPSIAGGTARLLVDGETVASGRIDKVAPIAFSTTETMDIGVDLGATVSLAYEHNAPFPFTGQIEKVTVVLE